MREWLGLPERITPMDTEKQPAAEVPNAETVALHALNDAFRAFRKKATTVNHMALCSAMKVYATAQRDAAIKAATAAYAETPA